MSTRTAVLAKFTTTDGGGHDRASVPAGETWIVKTIAVTNNGTSTATWQLWVHTADSVTAAVEVSQGSQAANTGTVVSLWVVMEPADVLYFLGGVSGVAVWVSGTKLAGVAS